MLIQGNGIDSVFPPDRNNFAPRFGFAYQPRENGDLVVRGGIGVFYDQINMNPFLDFRPPISGADGLRTIPLGPAAVSNLSLNGYNWDAVQAGGASVFPGVTLCPSLNFNTDPGCGVPHATPASIPTTCTPSTRTSALPTSLTTTCRSKRAWAIRRYSRSDMWAAKAAS